MKLFFILSDIHEIVCVLPEPAVTPSCPYMVCVRNMRPLVNTHTHGRLLIRNSVDVKETGELGCTLGLVSTLISTFILCAECSDSLIYGSHQQGGPNLLKGGGGNGDAKAALQNVPGWPDQRCGVKMLCGPSTAVVTGLDRIFGEVSRPQLMEIRGL